MSGISGNIYVLGFLSALAAVMTASCGSSDATSEGDLAADAPTSSGGGDNRPRATGGVDGAATGAVDGGGPLLDPGEAMSPSGSGGAVCGSISVDSKIQEVVSPGNLLVVYDQSLSMNDDWSGEPRWRVASEAVVSAISGAPPQLTIGAVFFPSSPTFAVIRGLPCDVDAVNTIDDSSGENPQIPFSSGAGFLKAWAEHWKTSPLRLGTPTQSALERAKEALTAAKLEGPTAIVLVTDGAPTCGTEKKEKEIVAAAASNGTKTYVVGLPGSESAGSLLDALAQAGGTGQRWEVSHGAELEAALSNIASEVVRRSIDSCSVTFQDPPDDLSKVVLVVTDASSGDQLQIALGPDGWSLDADGRHAKLEGATCTDALAGRFSRVAFEFGCVEVPVLR